MCNNKSVRFIFRKEELSFISYTRILSKHSRKQDVDRKICVSILRYHIKAEYISFLTVRDSRMSQKILKHVIHLHFAEDTDLKYKSFAFIQKEHFSKYIHMHQSGV